MRKTALLMSLVVVSAVAGGSFAYGWYSVTTPPSSDVVRSESLDDSQSAETEVPESNSSKSGHTTSAESGIVSEPSSLGQSSIAQQLAVTNENGQVNVILNEIQLNQLVNDAILSQPQATQLLTNAQSLQTTLKGGRIETGALLNLSELPSEILSTELQTALDQLTRAAPMLANRDVYIGIVAYPQVQDGEINLEQDLNLKVGQFKLPLADVAEQLGISTSEIEQRLNRLIAQQGLTLNDIKIVEQQLVITGSRSQG